jgi:hypothetical protein
MRVAHNQIALRVGVCKRLLAVQAPEFPFRETSLILLSITSTILVANDAAQTAGEGELAREVRTACGLKSVVGRIVLAQGVASSTDVEKLRPNAEKRGESRSNKTEESYVELSIR